MATTKLNLQNSKLEYSWDPKTKKVRFQATVPNNSYFAIGFGKNMRNTDMILWQANSANSITSDLWSTGTVTPSIDKKNDLTTSFTVSKDKKSVTFITERLLDTKDL